MKKSVADLCRIMAASPDPKRIAITFLRYTGPLRPEFFSNTNFDTATNSNSGGAMVVTAIPSIGTEGKAADEEKYMSSFSDESGFGRTNTHGMDVSNQLHQCQPQVDYAMAKAAEAVPAKAAEVVPAKAAEDLPLAITVTPSNEQKKKKKGIFNLFKRKKKNDIKK